MRVLLAVLSPLNVELGASQIALNLANALRNLGIEAVVWSPYPIHERMPWWRQLSWMRGRLNEFVDQNGPFDIVDVLPAAVTSAIGKDRVIVARSVQPDLLYLWNSTRFGKAHRRIGFVRWFIEAFFNLYLALLVVYGWCLATRILCLGSIEFEWMRKWFPWWCRKLSVYVCAIAEDEREALKHIRQARRARSSADKRIFAG